MVSLSLEQSRKIIEIAESYVGIRNPENYDCALFVKDVYRQAGISTSFDEFPAIPESALFDSAYVGYPYFLRRLLSKRKNEVTHFGIIAPEGYLIHCSQRMANDFVYQIYKSHPDDLFKVYEFIEFSENVKAPQ